MARRRKQTGRQRQNRVPRGSRGELGRSGIITIRGHQLVDLVRNNSTSDSLFGAADYFFVDPDDLGGTLAAHANRFNKYRFKKLVFSYIPFNYMNTVLNTGVTVGGVDAAMMFAFGYESDPIITLNGIDIYAIANLQHSMVVPSCGYTNRRQNQINVTPNIADKWYYTERDVTNNGTARQTIQGAFFGLSYKNITTATEWGRIMINYVIEFSDACPDQGVSFRTLVREHRLGRSYQAEQMLKMIAVLYCGDPVTVLTKEQQEYLFSQKPADPVEVVRSLPVDEAMLAKIKRLL